MQVKVGSALQYKGANCICTEIEQINKEQLAREDSEAHKLYTHACENVRYLELEIEDFAAGDHICIKGERLYLDSQRGLEFIWTSYKITKVKGEEENGLEGSEGNIEQGASDKVESTGRRDSSGEGPREEGAGEVGGAIHGHGQGGEAGIVSASKDS